MVEANTCLGTVNTGASVYTTTTTTTITGETNIVNTIFGFPRFGQMWKQGSEREMKWNERESSERDESNFGNDAHLRDAYNEIVMIT